MPQGFATPARWMQCETVPLGRAREYSHGPVWYSPRHLKSPAKKRLQAFNFSGVSAHGLHVWRGDRHVLRGLSAEAGTGDCLHVAGPNGSGKTTLLRVFAGLLAPEEGSVQWQGAPIAANRDDYARSISYLGHHDALKADFTASENLSFEVGLRRRLSLTDVEEALARVGLSDARTRPARVLSAGQRRRLALARVWLAAAPLWILDEPFTNLDATGVALLTDAIAEHLDQGGAAIMAAHQLPAVPRHGVRRLDLGT